jgi:hypothetical protein
LKPLNLLQNLKTELGFFLEKHVGKMALFFVHAVEAKRSIESWVRDIGVKGANTPFMTSRTDGLTDCEFPIKSGSGLSSSLRLSCPHGESLSKLV